MSLLKETRETDRNTKNETGSEREREKGKKERELRGENEKNIFIN
jgi:hypothetical protein